MKNKYTTHFTKSVGGGLKCDVPFYKVAQGPDIWHFTTSYGELQSIEKAYCFLVIPLSKTFQEIRQVTLNKLSSAKSILYINGHHYMIKMATELQPKPLLTQHWQPNFYTNHFWPNLFWGHPHSILFLVKSLWTGRKFNPTTQMTMSCHVSTESNKLALLKQKGPKEVAIFQPRTQSY